MTPCLINAYFLTGELQRVSGAGTYTVEYTYDGRGRMKTMSTWQGATPTVTTWNYFADRGLLTSKVYADNQGPSYTYTAAGRLETRVWARGVTNAYSYNDAGDLESISYSDGTPTVTNTFNVSEGHAAGQTRTADEHHRRAAGSAVPDKRRSATKR